MRAYSWTVYYPGYGERMRQIANWVWINIEFDNELELVPMVH